MLDVGEDLVGAYLRLVAGCELVAFNTRTGAGQAEIDVIGVRLSEGSPSEVWFCEVSTHTSGLGGYRGDPVGKLATKLGSVRTYAQTTFPNAKHHVEFWSPKVRPGLVQLLEQLEDTTGVTLVVNQRYAKRVGEMASLAANTSAYSDHPSFRMLQILTCLKPNPLRDWT